MTSLLRVHLVQRNVNVRGRAGVGIVVLIGCWARNDHRIHARGVRSLRQCKGGKGPHIGSVAANGREMIARLVAVRRIDVGRKIVEDIRIGVGIARQLKIAVVVIVIRSIEGETRIVAIASIR